MVSTTTIRRGADTKPVMSITFIPFPQIIRGSKVLWLANVQYNTRLKLYEYQYLPHAQLQLSSYVTSKHEHHGATTTLQAPNCLSTIQNRESHRPG
jgi:hypothetical protein